MRRFLPVFAGFLSAGIFVLPQAASADPVTISIDAGADTYVRNGADNTNEGGAAFLRIQQSGNNRALVHFSQVELQGPLRGRNLISATLKADIVHNGNNWGSTGRTVDAHRMRQGWSEGNGKVAGISPSDRGDGPGATWNCAIDANISNQAKDCTANTAWNMGGSGERPWELVPTGTVLIQNQQSGTVSWDVTADVQAFLDGSVPNHGWLLRKTNEGQSGLVEFASRESGNPPSLVLVVENAISPEASAVIDADTGGCIEVEDPLSPIVGTGICIPPGALDEDTEIFIRVRNEDIVPDTEAFDWTPIGPPVEFGPAGLLFDIPAEVHLRFSMMDRFRFGGTDAEIHLLGQESLGDTPFLVTSFDIDEEDELITFDTGSFTTFQPFIFFTTAGRPGAFAVGDLNGDGIQDMVVGSGGAVIGDADGRITVYLGNDADNDSKGDGTFSSSEYLLSVLPVQRTGPVTGVNIADYTGDGIPDIAVYYNSILSTPDSHKVLIRIFKGQDSNNDGFGDGTFERITNCGGTPYYLTGDCGIGGYANMSAQMETADMNNDGKPDLVMLMTNQSPVVYCGMCSPRIHMYVMYNVGTAARLFAAPVRLDRSSTDTSGALYGWLSQIRIADFNGDSRPDIAAISVPNSSILEIYRNTGGRVDLAWTQPLCLAPFVGNTCPSGPFVGSPANFDEYAPLDILTTGGIFRGNGDISFQPLENHSGLTISPFYESVSATGHINPDMILDVVIGKKPITVQTNPYRYINALSVFMGNESSTSPGMGDASFHFDIDITYGSNFNRKDIRIADFNNDGCNDIVLLNDRNAPAAFLLTLNGSTGCAFDVQITVFEADPDIVAPGDTSTLSWGTINADACEILAGSVLLHVLDSGELAAGSFDVSPNATTTYTLTCQGHNGPVSAQAEVRVNRRPVGTILTPGGDELIAVSDVLDFTASCIDPDGDTDLTHSWRFNGAAPDSLVQNPGSIQFGETGTYVITYICTDSFGFGSIPSQLTAIVNSPPDGVISLPAEPVVIIPAGGSIEFTGTCTDPEDDVPFDHLWTFGGGAPDSLLESPGLVAFDFPGTYLVTYLCMDGLGFADPVPDTRMVIVNSPPEGVIIQPDGDRTISAGVALDFVSSCTDPDDSQPFSHLWVFSGPEDFTSTDQDPTNIVFNLTGTYTVTYICTDGYGLSDTDPPGILVTVEAPEAVIIRFEIFESGQGCARLEWETENAVSCQITSSLTGEPDMPYNIPDDGQHLGNVSSGSLPVTPWDDVTYALTCQNSAGQAGQSHIALFSSNAQPGIRYVRANQTLPLDRQNGRSWCTAYRHIYDLPLRTTGNLYDMMWIARGRYTARIPDGIIGPTNRVPPVLTAQANVDVYGGFIGDETLISERPAVLIPEVDEIPGTCPLGDEVYNTSVVTSPMLRPQCNCKFAVRNNALPLWSAATVLDGDTFDTTQFGPGIEGCGLIGNLDIHDSVHVVEIPTFGNLPIVTRLNGLVISGGVAPTPGGISDTEPSSRGGGVYVAQGNVLRDVIFRDSLVLGNHAARGGGIWATGSGLVIENVVIRNNSASFSAGGLLKRGGADNNRDLIISDSIFSYNYADQLAGAIELQNHNSIRDSVFSYNRSQGQAGAIFVEGSARNSVTNSVFLANKAARAGIPSGGNGGAISFGTATYSLTITNTAFIFNEAYSQGGVINIPLRASINIHNTIFWGNKLLRPLITRGDIIFSDAQTSNVNISGSCATYSHIRFPPTGGTPFSSSSNVDISSPAQNPIVISGDTFSHQSDPLKVYLKQDGSDPGSDCFNGIAGLDSSVHTEMATNAEAVGLVWQNLTTNSDQSTDMSPVDPGVHYVPQVSGSGAFWSLASLTGPEARFGHILADPEGVFVLFGGENGNGDLLGDTWELADGIWTEVAGDGPPPRTKHAAVHDTLRDSIIMFGGRGTAGTSGDTWLYADGAWLELSVTGNVPDAREGHALAYDDNRDTIVLFGGMDGGSRFGDTWELIESAGDWAWTPVDTSACPAQPSPRDNHALSYDAAGGAILLFGGRDDSGALNDTWHFDGSCWSEQSPAGSSPSPRFGHAMAHDSAAGVVILFGGAGGGPLTWEWDGTSWNPTPSTGPEPRRDHSMAYDAALNRTFLFGGTEPGAADDRLYGDTWSYGARNLEILHFAANPRTIFPGESATLAWQWINADSCTLDDGSGPVPLLVGSPLPVSPATSTAYTLECANSGGSVSATATVTVDYNVTVRSFAASAGVILPGNTAELSWHAANATSCEILPAVGMVDPQGGTATVSPSETTVYELVCDGPQGGPVSQFVTISVALLDCEPGFVDFGPLPVGEPAPSEVITCTNVSSVTLEIDLVASQFLQDGSDFSIIPLSGSPQIAPGDDLVLSADFTPQQGGYRQALLIIAFEGHADKVMVSLAGTGETDEFNSLVCDAETIFFGSVVVGETSGSIIWTCQNQGTGDLTIDLDSIVSTGDVDDFDILTTSSPPGEPIGPGEIFYIDWIFQPTEAGLRSASVSFSYLESTAVTMLQASGTGVVPDVQILSFTASPDETLYGQATQLLWYTQYSLSTCNLFDGESMISVSAGNDVVEQMVITPLRTTTYTLTCDGLNGISSQQAQTTISIAPVSILDFVTNRSRFLFDGPPTIAEGETATLSWRASSAAFCLINGNLAGSEPVGTSEQSLIVQPSGNTLYTLECHGPETVAYSTLQVNVRGFGPSRYISATPIPARVDVIHTLDDGSFIIAGMLPTGTPVVFGQGQPNETLIPADDGGRIFVAKYDPNHTFEWIVYSNSPQHPWHTSSSKIRELSDGSFVIDGQYIGQLIFNEGTANEFILPSSTILETSVFIINIASNGDPVWGGYIHGIPSSGIGRASYDVDLIDNLHAVFSIRSNSNSTNVVIGTTSGDNSSYQISNGLYMVRFAVDAVASVPLLLATADTFAETGRLSVDIPDDSESIYIASNLTLSSGQFPGNPAVFGPGSNNEIVIDPPPFPHTISRKVVLAKYELTGEPYWVSTIEPLFGGIPSTSTLLVDNDDVYIAGSIDGTGAVFGLGEPGEVELDQPFESITNSSYIAKYNSLTGAFDGVKELTARSMSLGAPYPAQSTDFSTFIVSISSVSAGRVLCGGYFQGELFIRKNTPEEYSTVPYISPLAEFPGSALTGIVKDCGFGSVSNSMINIGPGFLPSASYNSGKYLSAVSVSTPFHVGPSYETEGILITPDALSVVVELDVNE
ncbi:MAG: VCBS repeat-containing protein [Deltaproteobacteria bacterium]|nr:VCBS repeat-containing protein [Deltaproteobacteria bacterium]